MGCGASVQAPDGERTAPTEAIPVSAPSPIAEDVRAVQDQEPKERGQQEGTPPAAVPSPSPPPSPSPSPYPAAPDDQPPQDSPPGPQTLTPNADRAPNDQPPQATTSPTASTQPPSPPPDPPATTPTQPLPASSSPPTTRLILTSSLDSCSSTCSSSADRGQQPPGTPSPDPTALDPAVTPSSQATRVTLLAEAGGGGGGGGCGGCLAAARCRYTDESELSLSGTSYDLSGRGEDSEDELEALFTLQGWKRYYGYNKKKPQDLLTYFWRKLPPDEYSCFCISYRNQDLFVTPYMAENCVIGFCARIEDLGLAPLLFLQMYVLLDPQAGQYRIVGLLLVRGTQVPPQLAQLSAFDGFVYLRADTGVTAVKQFVSALLVGRSPLNRLQRLYAREVM